MSSTRIQVIWAHPRSDSLTATVTADVIAALQAAGAQVDELDLHREKFDPVLWQADEPDWDDVDKQYSAEVMAHAARATAADAVVFIFPVWWYSLPAILKGYIDRVWNHGMFYGDGRRAGIKAARWIGLAGESRDSFQKRRYDEMIAHHLNVGIAGLCGVANSRTELLYDALGEGVDNTEAHFAKLREEARAVATDLSASLQ